MRRTPDIEIDKDFTVTGEIVKAFVDSTTGERHIVGAASGLEEDRDGERVSANAINGMVKKVGTGEVKLTASHQQDWWSEIGAAKEAHIDDQTHQLMVDTTLPAEGVDPLADKAWKTAQKERLGFSIGGKLRHAFYELSDLGKRRKVLDSIDLRHVALTSNPSYTPSFAEAIAKTFEEPVEEGDFVDEELIKANLTTGSWAGASYGESGNSGQDSQTGGQRNAGKKKKKRKGLNEQTEDQQSEEGDEDEPSEEEAEERAGEGEEGEQEIVPTERHMACPNCGHEFAADLPIDMSQQEREKFDRPEDKAENEEQGERNDEPNAEGARDDEGHEPESSEDKPGSKKKPPTRKTEVIMDLAKTVQDLEELVAKQNGGGNPEPEPATGTDEVYKVVAASHDAMEERIEKLSNEVSEGFSLLANARMEDRELLANLPMGRKSTARILPPTDGHDGDVGKTATDGLPENATALDALKAMNADAYGIR